jgi:GNAT superfamily N-acetyltransferase
MASRRLRPLTAADLPTLPEPCLRCTFWEAGPTDLASSDDHRDRGHAKIEWAETVTAHWGYCGVLALHEDTPIGHLCMAPAQFVPRLGAFATTPVSPDAAVLLSARVAEEFRGKGIGRQLVQSAAGLVVRRDIRALEAVGTYADGPSCMLPAAWLEAVGFLVVRPHPITPRLRMDLQTSLRWPDLGAAWHRLAGLVSSPATPEPASYAHREP